MATKIFDIFNLIVIYLFIGVSVGVSICVSIINREIPVWLMSFLVGGSVLTMNELTRHYKNKNITLFRINIVYIGNVVCSCSTLGIILFMF